MEECKCFKLTHALKLFYSFTLYREAIYSTPPLFHRTLFLSCQVMILLFSMTRRALPAIVWKEGKWFIAQTVGLELASQGRNKKEALDNLQEALDLLLEDKLAYT